MHGSAHDKAQRQHGVLGRGKCVQRALRGIVTRLRTRRTLVVTAALVLLVLALLALCHARLLSQRPAHRDGAHDNATADAVADDSTPRIAASPTDHWLLRPDAPHGGSVRVMLLIVSTRVDAQLCYALASAYFADLPIVVLGYGGEYKSHVWRWQVYLDAIKRAGLRDRDVVLLLDSDILFSGEDMLPFIDDYIARSPATPSALDVRAVRAGTARAPSMFSAQKFCFAPQTYSKVAEVCAQKIDNVHITMKYYAARTGVAYDMHNESVQPLRYLNGGVSIHRVWSVRELARALQHYVATHKPREEVHGGWYDDQSVFALFYNDLRAWEVKDTVLRNSSTAIATTQRGPHGLRAGQLQLDQTGRLSTLGFDLPYYGQLSDVKWHSGVHDVTRTIVYKNIFVPLFTSDVWRRYGGGVRLQQRTLTRAGNVTHTIDLAPPLLSFVPFARSKDSNNVQRIFPLILHYAGVNKRQYMKSLLLTLVWYMPMRHNATRWQQGRAHLLTSFIDAWTVANNAKRVRYGDVCRNVALTQTDLRSFWCALTSLC